MDESDKARGLLALMLLHDSRRDARLNPTGELVLLNEQDSTLWDQEKIHEGITILDKVLAFYAPGPYQTQAVISALHAEAPTADATDWHQIVALYNSLAAMTQSMVVEVNLAVAVAMARSPQEGLQMLRRVQTYCIERSSARLPPMLTSVHSTCAAAVRSVLIIQQRVDEMLQDFP